MKMCEQIGCFFQWWVIFHNKFLGKNSNLQVNQKASRYESQNYIKVGILEKKARLDTKTSAKRIFQIISKLNLSVLCYVAWVCLKKDTRLSGAVIQKLLQYVEIWKIPNS